jgi:hypothetical protein
MLCLSVELTQDSHICSSMKMESSFGTRGEMLLLNFVIGYLKPRTGQHARQLTSFYSREFWLVFHKRHMLGSQ